MFRLEGSARGDILDRFQLNGTIDLDNGRIALGGKLDGLTLSKAFRRRSCSRRPTFWRWRSRRRGRRQAELAELRSGRREPAAL